MIIGCGQTAMSYFSDRLTKSQGRKMHNVNGGSYLFTPLFSTYTHLIAFHHISWNIWMPTPLLCFVFPRMESGKSILQLLGILWCWSLEK